MFKSVLFDEKPIVIIYLKYDKFDSDIYERYLISTSLAKLLIQYWQLGEKSFFLTF